MIVEIKALQTEQGNRGCGARGNEWRFTLPDANRGAFAAGRRRKRSEAGMQATPETGSKEKEKYRR